MIENKDYKHIELNKAGIHIYGIPKHAVLEILEIAYKKVYERVEDDWTNVSLWMPIAEDEKVFRDESA